MHRHTAWRRSRVTWFVVLSSYMRIVRAVAKVAAPHFGHSGAPSVALIPVFVVSFSAMATPYRPSPRA